MADMKAPKGVRPDPTATISSKTPIRKINQNTGQPALKPVPPADSRRLADQAGKIKTR